MGQDDALRAAVWARDEGICLICFEPADPLDWQLDHIVPRAIGGPDDIDNLRVAHGRCNRGRTDPRRMTDEQIAEAAAEWTANEFSVDRFGTFIEMAVAFGFEDFSLS